MMPTVNCEALTARERTTVRAALRILERRALAGDVLSTPGAVRNYLALSYAGEARERFRVLFLNTQHRLIAAEELFAGTLRSTAVHPREIARRALVLNAASVILVHNHPSGCAEPSRADEQLTDEIRSALGLIDVGVLDHLIVAGNRVVSLTELAEIRETLQANEQRKRQAPRRRRALKSQAAL